MTTDTTQISQVMWQTDSENGVAEPAILIGGYFGILCLEQDGNSINVNYDSLEEFIKALRATKKRFLTKNTNKQHF